jgi:hypothetical protein
VIWKNIRQILDDYIKGFGIFALLRSY